MPRKPRTSEVHAYIFIKEDLKNLGWNPKNPARSKDPQGVYTQGECLDEPRIAEQLGQTKPENIVKISETEYYVIEAKAKRSDIDLAIEEAVDYAKCINRSTHISVKIVSGLAGNDEDGYLVKSRFLVNGRFKPIISNEKELTSLVSPKIAEHLLTHKTNIIEEIPIDWEFFRQTAEKINVILHNGAVPATERGKVMSALLLSLVDETPPNVNARPRVLIQEINARVNSVLAREGRPEFYDYVKIGLPTTETNHVKFKSALVKTIQELNNLNIRSAMNSGTDILGNFYEVFLKYGNWAKEIGIVLTPRHITAFAAEVLNVNHRDIIYDPTCGTAGFLVAAFDYVKKNCTPSQIAHFKEHNIFGIEQEASVVALAIVNMIFRGDGKNNIKDANCLHEWLNLRRTNGTNTAEYVRENSPNRIPPVTKVLMNPPFALKEDADKEYKFVGHALQQMQRGGLLFSVLPISEMLARGQYATWRKELLKQNTLIAVITFPPGLFYPIGVNSCGIIVKKGITHPREQKVMWLRAVHDGFVIRKGTRRPPKPPLTETDFLGEYKELIKRFIANPEIKIVNVPEVCKLAPIDFDDPTLELVPEVYLDEKRPTLREIRAGVDKLVRITASHLITISDQEVRVGCNTTQSLTSLVSRNFDLIRICNVERKYAPYMNEILSDQKVTPYVTTTEISNGISIRCDSEPNFSRDTITVSLDGTCGTTFYQFEDYIAGEKTAVLTLHDELNVPTNARAPMLFYIGHIIRRKSWRYHYGRKLSEERLQKFTIPLPVKSDDESKIDYDKIRAIVESSYGWEVVKAHLVATHD